MQTSKKDIIIFLIVATVIILLLATLVITILYLYQKKQLSYNKNLSALKLDYEKNIMASKLEIQENTFQNIAREIHDNINLSLTLAKLHLNTISTTDAENLVHKVENSIKLITQTIHDLSNLSKSFHSDIIKSQGLFVALKKEINRISETRLFKIEFVIEGDAIYLDMGKELIIFRIIQESFNNIIKHANATITKLKLEYKTSELNITISDNGKGMASSNEFLNSDTAGLKNMQSRVSMLGGTMKIESIKMKGTKLLFIIPF